MQDLKPNLCVKSGTESISGSIPPPVAVLGEESSTGSKAVLFVESG